MLVAEGAFEVVVFDLVEAVHVELPDEAVHFVVAEVAGQYDFLELLDVLDDEFQAVAGPVDDLLVLFHLNYMTNTRNI